MSGDVLWDVHEGAIVRILPHVQPDTWIVGASTPETLAAWPPDDLLVATTVGPRLVTVVSLKNRNQLSGYGHARSGIVPRECVEVVVPRAHRWDLASNGHERHAFAVWYQQQFPAPGRAS